MANRLLYVLLVGLISFTLSAQVPTDGLVAFYPFDNDALDHSNNSNAGTAYNTVPAADRYGRPDRCYYFNGTDAYIAIPSSPTLNPTDQLTINLWIKIG
ncbi:MAG: hypothetical protein KAT15_09255, partial [Bacteroidales bacterium]|nr:hypothetical protein [Bacteroidales bacterium]